VRIICYSQLDYKH